MARPPIGPPVNIRMTADMVRALDDWADRAGMTRAAAARYLLTDAIERNPPPPGGVPAPEGSAPMTPSPRSSDTP